MKIKFCTTTGVPPYSGNEKYETDHTVLPRIGECVQDGNYRYRVTNVTFNYRVDVVFVNVEPYHG